MTRCNTAPRVIFVYAPWFAWHAPRDTEDVSNLSKNILITGGAGFVGSHLADALIARGHNVRLFDNLTAQVHGSELPAYLPPEAELLRGDVNDSEALLDALTNMDIVFHLAAAVGVGQSMYQIAPYLRANTLGTALMHQRDEERIRHEAVHDPLTGLPNRTLLWDRLDRALARSLRDGGATGVLFVDLDNFKDVNDAHGHAAGDAVLVELGRRLQSAIRPTDTVARIGGDEFVVVCEQVDESSALALGRRLEHAIEQPLLLGELEHQLSASIGISIGRSDRDALVRRADAALYGAKARGSGSIEVGG